MNNLKVYIGTNSFGMLSIIVIIICIILCIKKNKFVIHLYVITMKK